MTAASQLAAQVGVRAACSALGVPRPTYYRRCHPPSVARPRPRPPLALSAPEEQTVLDVLHSERFVDQSPTEVYATLLDDGVYTARRARCIACSTGTTNSTSAAANSSARQR